MYKVAIISCGMIASSAHIPAYKSYPDRYEIVAVCDVNAELAEKTAKEHGIAHYYTDAEEMLRAHKPDVVSVCVPNMLHKKFTMLALSYGAHVLCEKPLAFTYADAKEMFDYAAAQGKRLMACQSLRFLPERLDAYERMQRGEIGEVYYAEMSRIRRRGIPTWGKFHIKAYSGGGALVDIGVHGLDSALWLMGNPQPLSVSAVMNKVHTDEHGLTESAGALKGWAPSQKFDPAEMDVESFSSGTVRFVGGKALTFKVAWAANLSEENNLRFSGATGGIDLENREYYCGVDTTQEVTVAPNGFKDEPFYGHFCLVKNLVDVLDGQAELFVKPEETLTVTAVLEAAYLSAAEGREVRIDEIV